MKNLYKIAKQLVCPGKGILAADESVKTMTKRLDAVGVESTLLNRSLWREIMLTSRGVANYISGVILFDETLREPTPGGLKIAELLKSKNILAGIKVDAGIVNLPGFPEETFTQGLDKLGKRFEEYAVMGASFTKWRAVYVVNSNTPSKTALEANAVGLAEYAALAQQAGIVPIVEPEVLVLEGSHSIEVNKEATMKTLSTVFDMLKRFKVDLAGILLKPNMVLPSKEKLGQTKTEDIARETVETLLKTVPQEVPGIVFLSGGLNPDQSTEYLSAMNRIYMGKLPWQLSYSYGRALQQEALHAWRGKSENIADSQKVFLSRAQKVSQARFGKV
jgi:fructose-bisphosphate aldolase class I